MNWLIQYAFALVEKTPRYQWGGDDPIIGFDCSGFVSELLLASGELPFGSPKMNAQGIYDRYEQAGRGRDVWGTGALAFYGINALHIVHVGFCLDQYCMLEAGGGDETTISADIAAKRNAFLKMRPIKHRKDFFCVIKPSYSKLGMA